MLFCYLFYLNKQGYHALAYLSLIGLIVVVPVLIGTRVHYIVDIVAGLIYGYEEMPKEWIKVLVRKEDILILCDRLNRKTT